MRKLPVAILVTAVIIFGMGLYIQLNETTDKLLYPQPTFETIIDSGVIAANGGIGNFPTITIIDNKPNYLAKNTATNEILFTNTSPTVVIQKSVDMLTEGGIVLIKAGNYTIHSRTGLGAVTITNDGVFIIGEGLGTRINYLENGEAIMFDGSTKRIQHGGITNLHLVGNPTHKENHGFRIESADYIQINSNFIENIGDEGIIFHDVSYSSISDNVLNNTVGLEAGAGAINIQNGGIKILISNNVISNSKASGIHLEQLSGFKPIKQVTIIGNIINNATRNGILMNAINATMTDITVINNEINDAYRDGILLYGKDSSYPKNVLLIGNTITNGGESTNSIVKAAIHGVRLGTDSNVIAVANIINGYGEDNPNRRGIQNIPTIIGNTIVGVGKTDIFQSMNNTIIVSNYCTNNLGSLTGKGILVTGYNATLAGNMCSITETTQKD